MGSRPRSPSPCPAPWWGPQPGGPRLSKRFRWEEPEVQAGPIGAAGVLTSVVALAAGCAMQLRLLDADLVLEAAPTSVLRVSLGDHTLILVHEALLGSVLEDSRGESDSPVSLELGSFLSAPGDDVAVAGSFRASVSETAAQAEEEADPEFLQLWINPQAGSVTGLRPSARRVPSPCPRGPILEPSPRVPSLDSHLLGPFPNSPLQPLPPSPSPGPHERPQRSPRPPCRAGRCLF
ncbi:LOW QUALITY PROTEIN: proline-rich protein 23C-like [Dugong dugon]